MGMLSAVAVRRRRRPGACAASRHGARRATGAATTRPSTSRAAEARILRELLGGAGAAPPAGRAGGRPSRDVPDALFDGYIDALEEAYRLRRKPAARVRRLRGRLRRRRPAHRRPAAERLRVPPPGHVDARRGAGARGGSCCLRCSRCRRSACSSRAALPHGKALLRRRRDPTSARSSRCSRSAWGSAPSSAFGFSMWLWSQIDEHTEPFVNALALFFARAALVVDVARDVGRRATRGARPLARRSSCRSPGRTSTRSSAASSPSAKTQPGDAFVCFLQHAGRRHRAPRARSSRRSSGRSARRSATSTPPTGSSWCVLAVGLLAGLGIPLAIALSNAGGLRSFFLRERPEQFPLLSSLAAAAAPGNPAALAHALRRLDGLWHDPRRSQRRRWPTCATRPAGARSSASGGRATATLQIEPRRPHASRSCRRTAPRHRRPSADREGDRRRPRRRACRRSSPACQAEVVGADDPAYDLPFPQTLADPGDTRADARRARRARGRLRAGRHEHATTRLPAPPHAARRSSPPPTGSAARRRTRSRVWPLVPQRHARGSRPLGARARRRPRRAALPRRRAEPGRRAVVRRSAGAAAGAPAPLAPVYQVFRQWNLDERRVNEWRMLVQGGAESEKAGRPLDRDPAMRPNPMRPRPPTRAPRRPASRSPTAMGWIPLWRAWLRMATDVTADTTAATADALHARRRDAGRPHLPTDERRADRRRPLPPRPAVSGCRDDQRATSFDLAEPEARPAAASSTRRDARSRSSRTGSAMRPPCPARPAGVRAGASRADVAVRGPLPPAHGGDHAAGGSRAPRRGGRRSPGPRVRRRAAQLDPDRPAQRRRACPALAIHPTDPLIMYAGAASGGVYKTIDGGETLVPAAFWHDAAVAGDRRDRDLPRPPGHRLRGDRRGADRRRRGDPRRRRLPLATTAACTWANPRVPHVPGAAPNQAFVFDAIAVHPTNRLTLLGGRPGRASSGRLDGGANWTQFEAGVLLLGRRLLRTDGGAAAPILYLVRASAPRARRRSSIRLDHPPTRPHAAISRPRTGRASPPRPPRCPPAGGRCPRRPTSRRAAKIAICAGRTRTSRFVRVADANAGATSASSAPATARNAPMSGAGWARARRRTSTGRPRARALQPLDRGRARSTRTTSRRGWSSFYLSRTRTRPRPRASRWFRAMAWELYQRRPRPPRRPSRGLLRAASPVRRGRHAARALGRQRRRHLAVDRLEHRRGTARDPARPPSSTRRCRCSSRPRTRCRSAGASAATASAPRRCTT